VFVDEVSAVRERIQAMKQVFDQDSDSGTITIAITSKYESFAPVPEAYREAQERIGDRRLIDSTQVVDMPADQHAAFGLTQEQAKEIQANVKEGNAQPVVLLLERCFAKWRGEPITAAAWMRFAGLVTATIRQAAASAILNMAAVDDILANSDDKMQRCVTVEELELLLMEWVAGITDAIRDKRDRKDAITTFVMDYVNDHLANEIYLDILADKLQISSGYLSTYFKEKTGINLMEYVNEARIKRATVLLVESQLKIQEVAEAVGYRNITSFNRMFKKYTGLKPSDYRKNKDAYAQSGI
jgi:two-component system, response regulator YesN